MSDVKIKQDEFEYLYDIVKHLIDTKKEGGIEAFPLFIIRLDELNRLGKKHWKDYIWYIINKLFEDGYIKKGD